MIECAPRYATPRTLSRKTYGKRIAVVAEALGKPLMPWQRMVADVIGEVHEDTGRMAYREYRITVPRQSGKTTLILPKLITRCLSAPMMNCVYTAQTAKDARKKFVQEQIPMLNNSSIFRGRYKISLASGEERITWGNGSRHSVAAVTEKAGHGGTLDDGVIDEAFAQIDARVEQAMRPAMSTRPDAQLGIVSTAGDDKSVYLLGKVNDGRARAEAGQRSGVAYFEWSALDGMDPNDPATWLSCMPALGHTQSIETIAADRDGLASMPGEFDRAYLNLWPAGRTVVQVIPAEAWAACADPGAQPSGRLVWSVEVSLDRAWAAIGCASRTADGRELVELIEYKADGTQWVVPRLRELRERHGRADDVVGVDASGPAGSLIADLEATKDADGRDVDPFTVKRIPAQGKAQAAGAFFDAATGRQPDDTYGAARLVHRNQTEINDALASAVKYISGDTWQWSRGASLADICPLTAATYALWALSVTPDDWYDVMQSAY